MGGKATDKKLFLDGACDIFAKALHDTYGYRVMACVNRTGRLLHAFCMIDNVYIDAAGKHDSLKFLRPYIGARKACKLLRDYDVSCLSPVYDNDIYTQEAFDFANQLALDACYKN